jgi:signal transduction histidine kinase
MHADGRTLAQAGGFLSQAGPMPEPQLFWFTSPLSWIRSITNSTFQGPDGAPVASTVEIEGNDWLGIQLGEASGNYWFYCLGEAEVGSRVSALVDAVAGIPDYFGIGVELSGRKLTWSVPDLRVWHEVNYFGRRGGGEKKEYTSDMASTILASARRLDRGTEQLKVNVYLTSPTALFKRQSARTFWFGFLIVAAALAALVGFLAAYRAFRRQLRLSEMKSNFVSSVSHELRAPIASVRLLAENLERGRIFEAPKQREYFRFIVQECRRLSSLIENVLDFSRIEQGRKEYEFEPTDVQALVEQTVRLMESYAGERDVKLVLALGDCPSSSIREQVLLDGKAIQQALINLIDNAIKHSPKGQIVTVGAEVPTGSNEAQSDSFAERGHPADHINLWVEDQGEGIPAAEHEKIFERFYRRGSELRRETSGVGIGLSIVKHIVEAHRGRVLVRSVVGQGSRFTIELPLSAGEQKSEIQSPKPE